MSIAPQPQQPPGEVVLIGGWYPDEDSPRFPLGRKPKRFLTCPGSVHQPYLVPGHRYLFKEAEGAKAQQVWSEIIAYEIGRHTGVPVPPAFAAVDEKTGTAGVLIEFFYGWPNEATPARFVHAIERFQGMGLVVDENRGSLRDNIALSRSHKVDGWDRWWAEVLAFDALIGNTDRHSENWGFLIRRPIGGESEYSLAPAFDNGTSLAFLIRDADLGKWSKPEALERHVARGAHHYSWLGGEDGSGQHAQLCARFAKAYPSASEQMRNVIRLSDSEVDGTVEWCSRFEFPVPFTQERAEFVSQLIKFRRKKLAEVLGA